MIRTVALAALALSVASAAVGQSLWSYKWTADAKIVDGGGREYSLYIHPKEDTLLLQPRISYTMRHDREVQNLPIDAWRRAAEAFVQPAGCGISDVSVHGSRSLATWQATFVCPPGVDLRKLAAAQHDALMRGEPLHGPSD